MKCKSLLWLVCSIPLQLAASCGPCDYIIPAVDTETVMGGGLGVSAFSPQGCLAVADFLNNTILLYSVDASCTATPTIPSITTGISNPRALAFSSNGCLAVSNVGSGAVTIYPVGADCTAVDTPSATISPLTLAIRPNNIAFSPTGDCLAIATTTQVELYSVDAACVAAEPATGIITFAVGQEPISVAFSPTGNCLAVGVLSDAGHFVNLYAIDSNDCTVDPLDPTTITDGISTPSFLAFSPNGCLAVGNVIIGLSTVNLYSVDATNCTAMASNPPIAVGNTLAALAFSANNCLAVGSSAAGPDVGGTITIYPINGLCQALEIPQVITLPVDIGTSINSAAFAPTPAGCLAVVSSTGEVDSTVSLFARTIPLSPLISVAVSCNIVTVTGTTTADASVTVFVNGVPAGVTTADATGAFTLELAPLAPGAYVITAQATSGDCTSGLSNAEPVVISAAPSITAVSPTCLGTVRITGTASSGASITILIDGIAVATGTANQAGNFSIANVTVAAGIRCFTALDSTTGCTSTPVCLDITFTPCVLAGPNLATCGSHCCNR